MIDRFREEILISSRIRTGFQIFSIQEVLRLCMTLVFGVVCQTISGPTSKVVAKQKLTVV